MSTAPLVRKMGKVRGRPPKPEDEGTRSVKLNVDLVDMITWIVRIRKRKDKSYTAAQLIDPLLRPQIKTRYEQIESEVEKIKKAEGSAAAKTEEKPESE